jgi:glucose-6-phosphate 1-dehydrogenase
MGASVTVEPRKADRCSFVVFGATGDLTRRLLVPALYNLAAGDLLPAGFAVVGFGRSPQSVEAFRGALLDGLGAFATRTVDPVIADRLLSCITYVQGDIDDPQAYERLKVALERIEQVHGGGCNRLFYLALPPNAFAPTVDHLSRAGLTDERSGCGWRHVILEKPFGTDLASARTLNRHLLGVLDEEQIYRIDHYLGKETVQNIMVLRFANGLFEPIWNRNHIDHVQITVAETVTVERRGRFYDATGALRDMVPNHLFQLLSLIAMEPPSRFDARSVRSEKAAALDAVRIPTEAEALRSSVRAQYAAGTVKGAAVEGYRDAPDVRRDSSTETYAALKLEIDNWRWAGVPFYLRTGKALAARRSEVRSSSSRRRTLSFGTPRRAPGAEFPRTPHSARRGHHAALQRQGARPGHRDRRRRHDVQVQGLLRRGSEHRIRDADLRLHGRRCDAVSAGRCRRSGMADRAAVSRRMVGGGRRGACLVRGRQRGA